MLEFATLRKTLTVESGGYIPNLRLLRSKMPDLEAMENLRSKIKILSVDSNLPDSKLG